MIIKHSLFFIALILISLALYYPGIHGPFVFDDLTSITKNSLLQLTELDSSSLFNVATSGNAGPLKRPVAMLSFALNYYFAGTYEPVAFKLTNIIIHGINTVLLFILSLQILTLSPAFKGNKFLFAAAVSLIWCAHPINLTSVLYVVQRMTALSTLFSLSCIILYISARQQQMIKQPPWRSLSLFIGSAASLSLALFSKENAVLVPLFILLIEWLFFSSKTPWRYFTALATSQRTFIWLSLAVVSSSFLIWVTGFAEPGFSSRPFSMYERVLTESRVICFYLSLIFIPRINAFGLFHDDISISTSLLTPWTTIPSILLITALILTALHYRKKNPLFTFGILWFFIGHLLESTIFSLEIAHEHRNHLPSMGIILAAASLLPYLTFNRNKLMTSVAAILLILGLITHLRATQWSSYSSLAYHEAKHHPASPASQVLLSNAAFKTGQFIVAIAANKQAMTLAPHELAHALNYQQSLAVAKQEISHSTQQGTLNTIKNNKLTAFSRFTLDTIANCLNKPACSGIRLNYIEWIDAVIEKNPKKAYYHYLKGKAELSLSHELLALNSFQHAHSLDKKLIHPLFEIANIFLRNGQLIQAEKLVERIESTNQITPFKRDKEIQHLKEAIKEIKSNQ